MEYKNFKRVNIALPEEAGLINEGSHIWANAFPGGTPYRREVFFKNGVYIFPNKRKICLYFPEDRVFPVQMKVLGESIALDKTNQFFICTYSPYLISALLEKTPKEELAVFVVYWRDGRVERKQIPDDRIPEFMEYDPFFNLYQFIEEV